MCGADKSARCRMQRATSVGGTARRHRVLCRSSPRETEAQVLALVNDPRYDKDEAFRMDVRKRLSMAKGVK